jgi:hypothetical protein
MLISCERSKKLLLQRRPLPTRLALQRNECLDIGGTCTILILGWLAYSLLQQKMCLGVPGPFDPLFSANSTCQIFSILKEQNLTVETLKKYTVGHSDHQCPGCVAIHNAPEIWRM